MKLISPTQNKITCPSFVLAEGVAVEGGKSVGKVAAPPVIPFGYMVPGEIGQISIVIKVRLLK